MENLKKRWKEQIPKFLLKYKGIAVACSGGVDSTVLFHLLWHFAKDEKNFPLAISHINFGLRPKESDFDQQFLEDLARERRVPIFTHVVQENERSKRSINNIQSWARQLRYNQFEKLVADGWIIALAHQLDDLAENVILRLARGSSPGSLAGMQEWNEPYWRPLLGLPKSSLCLWASRHNVPHRLDASNDKMDYSRNVIRHKVLPQLEALFPGAKKRIARAAGEAYELSEFTRSHLGLGLKEPSTNAIAVVYLNELPNAVALEALANLIGKIKEGRRRLTHKFLSIIIAKLHEDPLGEWSLQIPAGGGFVKVEKGLLRIVRTDKEGPPRPKLGQHERSLHQWDQRLVLEGKAGVEFFSAEPACHPLKKAEKVPGQKSFALENSSLPAKQFRVYLPKAAEVLRFSGNRKKWLLKELMRLAGVPPQRRSACLILQEFSRARQNPPVNLGIIAADELLYPDEKGRLKEGKFTVKCQKFNYHG